MELRINYGDTDAGGVVNHANYLSYFERARSEYLRERGLSVSELAAQGHMIPLVNVEIDYRAPALHDDLLRIETKVLELGKRSFIMGQKAVRATDDKLLVDSKVTLVCVSPDMKSHRLPEELLQALEDGHERVAGSQSGLVWHQTPIDEHMLFLER